MNRNLVDALAAGLYALAGRAVTDTALTLWERALEDLPDFWLADGCHLGEQVAVELARTSTDLVMPAHFRAAYLARAPRIGHRRDCACAGVGLVSVDIEEDRWARCPAPAGFLDEDTPKALPAGSPVTIHDELAGLAARLKARSAIALYERGLDRRPLPVLPTRQPWQRPDETYFAGPAIDDEASPQPDTQ